MHSHLSYCLISIILFSVCVRVFLALYPFVLGQFFSFVLILFIFQRKFILSQTIHIELISYTACIMCVCVCEKVVCEYLLVVICFVYEHGNDGVFMPTNTTLTNFFSFHQPELFVGCHTMLISAAKSLNSLSFCCCNGWHFFLCVANRV